jgi:hypothetical protein
MYRHSLGAPEGWPDIPIRPAYLAIMKLLSFLPSLPTQIAGDGDNLGATDSGKDTECLQRGSQVIGRSEKQFVKLVHG